MHGKTASPAGKAKPTQSRGSGRGPLQDAADRSPATHRLEELNTQAKHYSDGVAQRAWTGAIPPNTNDIDLIQQLEAAGYDTSKTRPWKVASLRKSDTEYSSLEEVAVALSLPKTDASSASADTTTATVEVVAPPVVSSAPELTDVARVEVQVPKPKAPDAQPPKPKVPSGIAHGIAARFMAAVENASANASKQSGPPAMKDTGREKIYAPQGDLLTVYRAEKKTRQTLEERRAQGGLAIWRPSSSTVKEAYDNMFAAITGGETLGEFQFTSALKAYTQGLRASGQPDNLATARTADGAFVDDFNYTITIPGVKLFKWTRTGIGDRIAPGAEIKADYIVLNADTIEASTVFGIGHYTGTQEVSFYTDLPADMIESVQLDSFDSAKLQFQKPT